MILRREACGSSVYTHSKSLRETLWPILDVLDGKGKGGKGGKGGYINCPDVQLCYYFI